MPHFRSSSFLRCRIIPNSRSLRGDGKNSKQKTPWDIFWSFKIVIGSHHYFTTTKIGWPTRSASWDDSWRFLLGIAPAQRIAPGSKVIPAMSGRGEGWKRRLLPNDEYMRATDLLNLGGWAGWDGFSACSVSKHKTNEIGYKIKKSCCFNAQCSNLAK